MKSKTKGIQVVKLIAFLMILAVCTLGISRVLKDKNNYLKYSEFYEEKEPFDVLIFGSSRILNAVHPMELWDEYGITSYNMAQHSENLRVTYWQLKNAFQYNVPEVAVVDVSLFNGGEITDDDDTAKSYLHKSLDHMPLTKIKYDALRELTEGVDISEYLFPLVIYHNRWNELERNDVYMVPSGRMGAEARIDIEPMERMEWSNKELIEGFSTELIKLDAMISLCEEKGVKLIFTCMPTVWAAGDPGVCSVMNYLEVYAKEHDIPFLNYAKEDDFINYATDFYDSSHLNPSGGKKLTLQLGAFLSGNYDMQEKSDSEVEIWEKRAVDYKGIKRATLVNEKNNGNIANYLMLLNDNDYEYTISMQDKGDIEKYGIAILLQELGVNEKDILFGKEEGISITVIDKETGESVDEAVF